MTDAAIEKLRLWTRNPIQFVRDNFKVEPDQWQADALRKFADPRLQRISLQACAGPGKSSLLAWMGWNFISCYGEPGDHPKGACVAITSQNLRDNLWAEFAKWRERSPYLTGAFEWNQERISSVQAPETWFISARSWSKKSNAEEQGRTLSGLHSGYVIALIDESGEIPTSVLRAGEQALSNCKVGKIIQSGNPTSHEGMLYAAATNLRHQWHVIEITGDPEDPNRSPRIDKEWAREQIAIYGRENPWVKAYILGQFPDAAMNTLLSIEEVLESSRRNYGIEHYEFAQKRIGVDVARFGSDATVLFPRQGLAAFKPVVMRNSRTNEIAARVADGKAKFGSEIEFVDDTGGYGAGVVDALLQSGITAQGINFGGKALNPRYFNKRTEMWFEMAEWIRRGGAIPNDPELIRELTTPLYTFHQGKMQLEEKDQIKKRLGHSCDKADALALTFALPDQPGMSFEMAYARNHAQKNWDPNSVIGD
jgi:hypothetical protein